MNFVKFLVILGSFFSSFALLNIGVNITLSDLFFILTMLFFPLFAEKIDFPRFRTLEIDLAVIWMLALVGLVCSFCLWGFFSPNQERGIIVSSQYFFSFCVVPLVLITFIKRISCYVFISSFVYGVTFISFFGIVSYFFFPFFASNFMIGGRMGSLVGNPNILSKLIAVTFPLLFFLYIKKYFNIYNFSIQCLIYSISLMLASSFGGFLSVFFSILIFFILSKQIKNGIFIFFVLSLVTLIFISQYGVPEIFQKRIIGYFNNSSSSYSAGSVDLKKELAVESLDLISKQPFRGLGADEYQKHSKYGIQVHNSYLLIWAEGGFFAFLCLLIIFFVSLWYGRLAIKTGLRIEGSVLVAVVLSLMLSSMTNTHIYNRFLWMPVYLSFLPILNYRKIK